MNSTFETRNGVIVQGADNTEMRENETLTLGLSNGVM